MMSLTMRFIWTIVYSLLQKRVSILEETTLRFRTMPDDCDFNAHMNNGRYLSIMDFGRVNFLFRMGVVGRLLKLGWLPVLGGAEIRYRRSLPPFRSFDLKTRVVGWDEKWLYIEQRFERNGELMAIATVKGIFRGKEGSVPISEVFRVMGVKEQSPRLPEKIKAA